MRVSQTAWRFILARLSALPMLDYRRIHQQNMMRSPALKGHNQSVGGRRIEEKCEVRTA